MAEPAESKQNVQRNKRLNGDDHNVWKEYMHSKQTKLQQQFNNDCLNERQNETSATEQILKGVSIYVNGYTVPPADDLKRLMIQYGGSYHNYYNPKSTTHVIASTLPNSKMKNLKTQKIVRPDWIVDSITAGRLLPYQDYKLYESAQTMIAFGTSNMPYLNDESLSSNVGPSHLPCQANVISCKPGNALPSSDVANGHKMLNSNTGNCLESKRKDDSSTFLSEFYSHSRLHHISTMGTGFRQYVDQLCDSSNGTFPGIERLKRWNLKFGRDSEDLSPDTSDFDWTSCTRVIMHIDMDCFFVSVGLRSRPQLRGHPIAVTHSRGTVQKLSTTKVSNGDVLDESSESALMGPDAKGSTSEIASCNYEARKTGVRNGMWLGDARKLCPDLVTIPYDFDGYKEVAQKLYDIVASYTLEIEAVSCDELFVDCAGILRASNAPLWQFASCIRNDVFQATHCMCSVGIARNMLLARIATKKAKPNGQFILAPQCEEDLLRNEDVANLPGVGRSIGCRLQSMGATTCANLQRISVDRLKAEFGPKMGLVLHNMSRGIDERNICRRQARQSVSAEVNYGIRMTEYSELQKLLKEVAGEVETRLRKIEARGKTITLKMKVRKPDAPVDTVKFMGHGLCDNLARSSTLGQATNDAVVIFREVERIFGQIRESIADIRGVGIQVSRLSSKETSQPSNTMERFLANLENGKTVGNTNGAPADQQHNKPEVMTVQKMNLRSPSKVVSSPRRDSSNAKRPSPLKHSPLRAPPFKYLSIDKHFGTTHGLGSNADENYLSRDTTSPAGAEPVQKAVAGIEHGNEQKRGLCEDMSYEEMSALFKEWIGAYDAPLTEDVDLVKDCICSAIIGHDLEKVDSLLRLLHRLISRKKGHRQWIAVYNKIVVAVQEAVMQLYGGRLCVDGFS